MCSITTVRILYPIFYVPGPADGSARTGVQQTGGEDVTNPFIPTHIYDTMKGKKKFKNMLVRSRVLVAPSYY